MNRLASIVGISLLVAVVACPVSSLEKRSQRLVGRDLAPEWRAGCTFTVSYANFCTGWIWLWSDFAPGERVGIWHDWRPPASPYCDAHAVGQLWSSALYAWTGSPAGYGFTGTAELFEADQNGCPVGAPLRSRSFLPERQGDNLTDWGGRIVPRSFTVIYTLGPAENNPLILVSDQATALTHDGAVACGTCFPVDRKARSFLHGTAESLVCPGVPFMDGECAVQLRHVTAGWGIVEHDGSPIHVESHSWGNIKALYR